LFIEKVEKFKTLKSSKNRYKEANKLIFLFMDENSEYGLNLSNHVKKDIMNMLNKSSESKVKITEAFCPDFIFNKAMMEVMLDLKNNVLEKFIKSQKFIDYANKNPQIIKEYICETREEEEENEVDLFDEVNDETSFEKKINISNMTNLIFTQRDFNMFLELSQNEKIWKVINKKNIENELYISIKKVTHGKKRPIFIIKENGLIPFYPKVIKIKKK
jgi:hypothetical protein